MSVSESEVTGSGAAVNNQREGMEMLRRMAEVASADAVFGEPVAAGDYSIITAAEVSASLGFGYGIGSSDARATEGDAGGPSGGSGGGGGGGGYTSARPVAVITAGPGGVRIDPIVDISKLSLAFFTMVGSLIVMVGRIRRAVRS